jgi:hypothetical protein
LSSGIIGACPAPLASALTAGDVLTLEELVLFRRASARRGGLLIAHAWLTIPAAAALYVAWPSALTLALAIVIIGARQLGLLVLMHETAHWLLFPQARLNTWGGRGSARPRWARICASTGAAITCTIATRNSPRTPT